MIGKFVSRKEVYIFLDMIVFKPPIYSVHSIIILLIIMLEDTKIIIIMRND